MAATPKHRRSRSKARSTKASNRYDQLLNKFRKIKKKGGTFLIKNKSESIADDLNKYKLPHKVDKNNPYHKNIKII